MSGLSKTFTNHILHVPLPPCQACKTSPRHFKLYLEEKSKRGYKSPIGRLYEANKTPNVAGQHFANEKEK